MSTNELPAVGYANERGFAPEVRAWDRDAPGAGQVAPRLELAMGVLEEVNGRASKLCARLGQLHERWCGPVLPSGLKGSPEQPRAAGLFSELLARCAEIEGRLRELEDIASGLERG